MMKLRTHLLTAIAAALFALPTMTASADITFTNNDDFDGARLGAAITVTDADNDLPVTLTIVDIVGEFGTSAAADPANNHNVNIDGSGNFAINTDNDQDSGFADIFDFNGLEVFTFSFDTDVTFQGITFNEIAPGGSATLQIGADTSFTLDASNGGVIADTLVDAGTEISIGVGSADFNISAINLDVIAPPSVVPEPSSLAVLGLLGSLATIRRRR